MNIDSPASAAATTKSPSKDGSNVAVSAAPPTLSSLVAELQRSLSDALLPARQHASHSSSKKRKYDAALLHPLAVDRARSSSLVESSKDAAGVHETVAQLSRTLASFEGAILNAAADPPAAGAGSSKSLSNNERLRLFALLKEQSALLQSRNTNEDAVRSATRLYSNNGSKRAKYPVQVTSGESVQLVLERIAKECKLEIFAGTDEAGTGPGSGEGVENGMDLDVDAPDAAAGGSLKKTTMTMAGKGLVLDVDIDFPSDPSGGKASMSTPSGIAIHGRVASVRFSHGMEGATDAGIDRLLTRQAQSCLWDAFRDSLASLAALDSLVSVPGGSDSQPSGEKEQQAVDPFGAMHTLSAQLEQVFEAELEVAASPALIFSEGSGLPSINQSRPYAQLAYYMPAEGFFSDSWDALVNNGFRTGASGESMLLEDIDGMRSTTFSLEKSDVPETQVQAGDHSLLQNKELLAGLNERIGSGLRIRAILDREVYISQAAGLRLDAILAGRAQSDPGAPPMAGAAIPVYTAIESLILPETNLGHSHITTAEEGSPQILVSNAPAVGERGFKLREFPFSALGQLLACTKVLRTQCLVAKVFEKAFEGTAAGSSGGLQANAMDKADEAQITLEDLFSGGIVRRSA